MQNSNKTSNEINQSSVHGHIGPSSRNMAIVTDKCSNHRLPIIMEPETPPQAESRVQIPGVFTRAERTWQIKLPPIPIIDGPPNPRPFEILENPSEEHVLPLLLRVNATRPIADVETVIAKLPREKLAPLFPAQVPRPGSQMGPPRPAYLPLLCLTRLRNNTLTHHLLRRGLRWL